MDDRISEDVKKAIRKEVHDMWNDHMEKQRRFQVASLLATYVAGLFSGVWLERHFSGPR